MSTLVREVCQFLGVRKLFTAPYHPEFNEEFENFYKNLKNGLACELHVWSKIWYKHMEYMLWAYHAQPHSVGGYSTYSSTWMWDARTECKVLSEYLKVDRETTEVKEVVNKLRGAWKINCETTQEGRRQQ